MKYINVSVKKTIPESIECLHFIYFRNINVLMYYTIDTYTNLQKGINITTSLPISFLKGILRKIYKKIKVMTRKLQKNTSFKL